MSDDKLVYMIEISNIYRNNHALDSSFANSFSTFDSRFFYSCLILILSSFLGYRRISLLLSIKRSFLLTRPLVFM